MVINGLILAGGLSRRMGEDKTMFAYHDEPEVLRAAKLLQTFCARTFISAREGQALPRLPEGVDVIHDVEESVGPLSGILSGIKIYSDAPWLVLAADLPLVKKETIRYLMQNRNVGAEATAYKNAQTQTPEPLCTIYEPRIYPVLKQSFKEERYCPRKILLKANTHLLELPDKHMLDNANTQEERKIIQKKIQEKQVESRE